MLLRSSMWAARARGSTYLPGAGCRPSSAGPRSTRHSKRRTSTRARAVRWWAWWRIRASARAGCAASSRTGAAPTDIVVTEGRGVAHGRRIPLLPVIEMLRGYFGIGEDDDARLAREKIAGRLLLHRRGVPGDPAGPVRLPRRRRSGPTRAADGPGGARARAVRSDQPARPRARRRGRRRDPRRGPALARSGQRGLPRQPGRVAAGHAHACWW